VKTVVSNVLSAAAAGALKGAVQEVIPPMEKAAGITEADKKAQEGKK
jgi:hypothetical protein